MAVNCSRMGYCRNPSNPRACMPCKFNTNSTVVPKVDNFKPKVGGIKFLP